MKNPWHKSDPALLEEIKSALTSYSDLRLVEEDEMIRVRGTFPVLDSNAEILDRYQVRIEFPPDGSVGHLVEKGKRRHSPAS
jgi:hypothetical protein